MGGGGSAKCVQGGWGSWLCVCTHFGLKRPSILGCFDGRFIYNLKSKVTSIEQFSLNFVTFIQKAKLPNKYISGKTSVLLLGLLINPEIPKVLAR